VVTGYHDHSYTCTLASCNCRRHFRACRVFKCKETCEYEFAFNIDVSDPLLRSITQSGLFEECIFTGVRYFILRKGKDTASTARKVLISFVDVIFDFLVHRFWGSVVIDESTHLNYTVRSTF